MAMIPTIFMIFLAGQLFLLQGKRRISKAFGVIEISEKAPVCLNY
jgi:hypothetical protein